MSDRENIHMLRDLRVSTLYREVGRADTGTYTSAGVLASDPAAGLATGYVWTRRNGERHAVRAANVVVRADLTNIPVWVGVNLDDELQVIDLDVTNAIRRFGTASGSLYMQPAGDLFRTTINGRNLKVIGRVHVGSAGGLLVVADEGFYKDSVNAMKFWLGTDTLDLTSNVPAAVSGVDQERWVLVALNPDASSPALVAVNGTAQSVTYPGGLQVASIPDIAITDGYYALAAVRLVTGDTTLTEEDFIDTRIWLEKDGATGGSFYQTLRDDGTDKTQRAAINFRSNAWIDFQLTDDGAGNETEVMATVVETELAALAGLTSAADKLPYFTGSGTAALADLTSFGRSLIDDANAAAGRGTLAAAPVAATYVVQTADSELSAEQALSSLSTGLMKVTTTTGVVSSVAAPSGTVVGDTDTQTLTNKTLTAPTIADFTNANHDHLDADDGGTLSASAIASGQLVLERGGTESDLGATGPGAVRQASAGAALTVALTNYSATDAPTVNDDTGDGYAVGSEWYDTQGRTLWRCMDASSGAAVWIPMIDRPGTLKAFAGTTVPTGWHLCYGQNITRTSWNALYAAITYTMSMTTASGDATVTVADTTGLVAGMRLEGTGMPASVEILSITNATTFELTANATATGTNTIRIFPFGNGNGSTTFTLPDLRGRTPIGIDTMGGTGAARVAAALGMGYAAGAEKHTLITAELPAHHHAIVSRESATGFGVTNRIAEPTNTGSESSFNSDDTGSGTAHNNLQPLLAVNWLIKD